MHILARTSVRTLALLSLVVLAASLLSACGSDSDAKEASGEKKAEQADDSNSEETADDGSVAVGEDGLRSIDGRAVSASDTELVLRTADGERTFQIKPEDVAGVAPGHYSSHVGIPTLGFRVYFRTEDDVEYAVSAEEIAGSDLGFD